VFVLPELEWERVTKAIMVVEEVVEVEDLPGCSLRLGGRRNRTRLRLTRVSAAEPFQRRLEKLHQHYGDNLTTCTWHRLEMNPPACIIRSWR